MTAPHSRNEERPQRERPYPPRTSGRWVRGAGPRVALVAVLALLTVVGGARAGEAVPDAAVSLSLGGPRTPALPPYLFNSGTPATNPFDICADCYSWSSTYLQASANHDLTARRFTVNAGAYAHAFRLWWAYGSEGPYDPFRNRGGAPGDFSRISIDLYAPAPGGGPGPLVANLDGTWTLLNAQTHYREFTLDEPYVFADSVYYLSVRAETSRPDYEAVILLMACAPHDAAVDYESAENTLWSTDGWDPYTTDNRPYNPCPRDMDFGLQVLGFNVPNGVDPVPAESCLTGDCLLVSFDFHRVDATPMRGYSVTFQLSPELRMCPEPDSIVEGTYLQSVGATTFQVLSGPNGVYTVDNALLGYPCGAVGVGNLFTIRVVHDPGLLDATGTITVTSVLARDCQNHPLPGVPGLPGSLLIDRTPPTPVTSFTAVQLKSGNNPPPPQPTMQVTRIQLDFVPPADAAEVEVYRAPFGNYPEYDDPPNPGAVPAVPSYPPPAPWTRLSGPSATPVIDRPLARDYWYYVAFVKDACGNVSDPTIALNPALATPLPGTLNYHLGDFSQGVAPVCVGDNRVFLEDLSLLGAHYGASESDPEYLPCVDIGPTLDGSPDAQPQTDNRIDFEDLMIFAPNFEQVGFREEPEERSGPAHMEAARSLLSASGQRPPELVLLPDEAPSSSPGRRSFRLLLRGGEGLVQGAHAEIEFDRERWSLASMEGGELLDMAAERAFSAGFASPRGVCFDAAMLGAGATFPRDGELAVLSFQPEAGPVGTPGSPPPPRLRASDLRDPANLRVSAGEGTRAAIEAPTPSRDPKDLTPVRDPKALTPARDASPPGASVPGELRLEARPNPSAASVDVRLCLPRAGEATVRVLDIAGRIVRSLHTGTLPAGESVWSWDGRTDAGTRAGAGVYLCVVHASGETRGIKIYRVR